MTQVISRQGTTLIELLAVITILAIVASVGALAMRKLPQPAPNDPHQAILAARRQALSQGIVVDTTVVVDGVIRNVTLLPDGRVMADSVVGVDRLTARFANDTT